LRLNLKLRNDPATLARPSSPRGIIRGMEWCSARMVAIVEGMYMRAHKREWPNGQWT
jgi:hypothetical protein